MVEWLNQLQKSYRMHEFLHVQAIAFVSRQAKHDAAAPLPLRESRVRSFRVTLHCAVAATSASAHTPSPPTLRLVQCKAGSHTVVDIAMERQRDSKRAITRERGRESKREKERDSATGNSNHLLTAANHGTTLWRHRWVPTLPASTPQSMQDTSVAQQ